MRLIDADYYCENVCLCTAKNCNKEICPIQNAPTIDTGDLLAKIAELEAELKEERYRHDRYVDFELDEAKELQALREKIRWSPVTERLPKEQENVLCTDGIHVEGGELIEGSFYDLDTYDSSIISGVTHWMPLPDPPEVE